MQNDGKTHNDILYNYSDVGDINNENDKVNI